MFIDLFLAILHHLLVFALAAALAAEFVLVRPGLAGRELKILGHIDGAYGGIAGAVILVGFLRVWLGLKGWEFYLYSLSFWGKMLAFAVVGALSVRPTTRILAWRRAATNATGLYVVPDGEIANVRRFIVWQMIGFAFILIFAAMMARGVIA